MSNWLDRTEMLIGNDNLNKLKNSTVAVFGIGGVGSFCVEALARVGVGNLVLIDNDVVELTNINRQLIADTTVIGALKVDVAKERVLKINPKATVTVYSEFYDESKNDILISNSYSYIVDAIDSVSSKLSLIEYAKSQDIPIISSMGTGNKLDPTQFKIEDIYNTSQCPLAKVMRKELRKRNINSLKVLFSTEDPITTSSRIPASISFVPSVAGLIIAGEVIKDILKFK